ncbi:MAG: hypothetical protein V3W52_17185 [Syntrophobacteria bacterium]
MTPLQLDILLHYHCRGNDYEQVFDNDTRNEQAMELADAGLLTLDKSDTPLFAITDKGNFYIKHLLNIPLPVTGHTIPDAQQ